MDNKKLENYTSYCRLKETLNKMSTYSNFLWTLGKTWNPVVTEDGENKNIATKGDVAEPGVSVTDFVLSKRNRLEQFNTEKGIKMRTSENHVLEQAVKPKLGCLLCRVTTSSKCLTCGVHLCRLNKNKKNDVTGWDYHHSNEILESRYVKPDGKNSTQKNESDEEETVKVDEKKLKKGKEAKKMKI